MLRQVGRRFRLPTVSLKTSDTAGPLVIPASSIVHLDAVIWNEWISHAAASHNGSAAAVFHCAHGLFAWLLHWLVPEALPGQWLRASAALGLAGTIILALFLAVTDRRALALRRTLERLLETGKSESRRQASGDELSALAATIEHANAPRARHGGNAATGECAARGHPGQYGGRPGRGGPAAAHHLRQPGVRRNDGRRRAARARHSIVQVARDHALHEMFAAVFAEASAAAAADPFRQHTVL